MTYKVITKHVSELQELERRACLCPGCPGTTSHHSLEWEGMPHAEVGLLTVLGDKQTTKISFYLRDTRSRFQDSLLCPTLEGD